MTINYNELLTKITNLNRELTNHQSRLTQTEALLSPFEKKLTEQRNIDQIQIQHLQTLLNQKSQELAAKQEEFNNLSVTNSNQENEANYLKQQIQVLKSEISQIKSEKEQKITELENQIQTKEQLIEQRNQEIQQERENLAASQQEKHTLSLRYSHLERNNQGNIAFFNNQLKELNILFDPAAINYTEPIDFAGLKNLISQFIQTSKEEKQNFQETENNLKQELEATHTAKNELLTKTATLVQNLAVELENNQNLTNLQAESEKQTQQLLSEIQLKKSDLAKIQLLQTRTKEKRDQILASQEELREQLKQDHLNYQTLIKQIQEELKEIQANNSTLQNELTTNQSQANSQQLELQTNQEILQRKTKELTKLRLELVSLQSQLKKLKEQSKTKLSLPTSQPLNPWLLGTTFLVISGIWLLNKKE